MTKSERKKIKSLESQYSEQVSEGSILGAIDTLSKLIEYDKTNWTYYYSKATLYSRLPNRQRDALNTVDEGLGYINASPALLALKAEILIKLYFDGNTAINLLEQAEQQYDENQKGIEKYLKNLPKDLDTIESNLKTAQRFGNYVSKLRSQAQIIITAKALLDEIKTVEKRIDEDKIKSIELLGIFSAVVAFVILSGQIAMKFEDIHEGIVFIVAFGLIQSIFAVLISLLNVRTKPFYLDFRFYILLSLVLCIAIMLITT